jgi:hypothetical protein
LPYVSILNIIFVIKTKTLPVGPGILIIAIPPLASPFAILAGHLPAITTAGITGTLSAVETVVYTYINSARPGGPAGGFSI